MEGYRDGYEARRKLGQGKEEEARKEGQLTGYEFGKDEEQAKWLAEGHGLGVCISMQQHMLRMVKKAVILDQTEVQTEDIETADSSTQTPTPVRVTVDATTQITPTPLETTGSPDSPTLTRNADTVPHIDPSTQGTLHTTKTATQTVVDHPSTPLGATTTSLMMAAQPPPTSSATTTTASRLVFQCEPPPPTAQKRRHSLPGRSTAPQHTPLPLFSHPEAPSAAATSPPTTVGTTAETTLKTTSRATSHAQTVTDTTEVTNWAIDDVHRRSTAQKTPLCDQVRTCSSEHVVHSTERFCQLPPHQRRSRSTPTPPSPPMTDPLPPVVPHEPTMMPHASTSPATSPSTTAEPPASHHSRPKATARKQQDSLPTRPTAPQLSPRPLFMYFRPTVAIDTSLSTTVPTPAETATETTTRATTGTQMATTTPETATRTSDNP